MRDNIVTIQEPCTKQEAQTIIEQEQYTEKERYVENVSVPTTTTNIKPSTVILDEVKQVPVQSIASIPHVQKQNVSQARAEAAKTQSIQAIRNDSSENRDQLINVQSKISVDAPSQIRKIPRSQSSTRQRASYADVAVSSSYETPVQGVSLQNQELVRQQTLSHTHSTLSPNNPNLEILDVTSVDSSSLAGNYYNSYKSGSYKGYARKGGYKGYRSYKKW